MSTCTNRLGEMGNNLQHTLSSAYALTQVHVPGNNLQQTTVKYMKTMSHFEACSVDLVLGS